MIELHQFAPAWGINPSPFCLKVGTYLQLVGMPYKAVPTAPFKGPKGKLPFIVDQGQRIPDSGQILTYLEQKSANPLDKSLSDEQKAVGHLIRRTCEESLYFVLLYSRWIDQPGWDLVRKAFFGNLPPVVRDVIPSLVRRGIARSLHGQGYGRHSRDEVYALGIADIDAISIQLGEKNFVVADQPTTFDATLYAFAASLLKAPVKTPLESHFSTKQNLCDYVARMDTLLAAKTGQ